jgi:glycosyltransferase involved in cell wall biosynthesis
MTITVDCRMFAASGVGVYLRECLPYLLDSPHRFVLLGNAHKLCAFIGERPNVTVVDCAVKPFSLVELMRFPRNILKTTNRTDLFYSPYFNVPGGIRIPVCTTIHDIVFPDMPELASKAGLMARMWFYRRAFARSAKIYTVSEFSKSRILHYVRRNMPVIVTYSAVQSYLLKPDATGGSVGKRETILFIGNIKKHKGLPCLLDAFFQTRREGLPHKLIIVGEKERFRTSDTGVLAKLKTADSAAVEFTGCLPDEKLKTLLAESALLVQPSLYEGFGLPPLEAMVCGTQALISDIPVFREIYAGFPVTFFRAGDSGDLKAKLMSLLYQKTPVSVALPEALRQKYTFAKTAAAILNEWQ